VEKTAPLYRRACEGYHVGSFERPKAMWRRHALFRGHVTLALADIDLRNPGTKQGFSLIASGSQSRSRFSASAKPDVASMLWSSQR